MKERGRIATIRLCRAGVIAALYVALTIVFGTISYSGIFEIRPAEALTILPLFFPEAVPALWIGCMLANLTSPFMLYDVLLGGLATLAASALTYLAGRLIHGHVLRVIIGGLAPVFVNAFVIPLIIVFLCGGADGYDSIMIAYWIYFASMVVTEGVWVYALGSLLYAGIASMQKHGVRVFLDRPAARMRAKEATVSVQEPAADVTEDVTEGVTEGVTADASAASCVDNASDSEKDLGNSQDNKHENSYGNSQENGCERHDAGSE